MTEKIEKQGRTLPNLNLFSQRVNCKKPFFKTNFFLF